MLPRSFDPAEAEGPLYAAWERSGAFAAQPDSNKTPFAIVIPPPNVTGSLHMGHALNNTLQDVLVRHARMTGRDALWMPGTDHAGIATQMVVERMLAAEKTTRQALGREGFVERVWAWKAESGGTITQQLRRLGASLDWPRERFTMDDGLSRAVVETFVTLHRQGLVYRDRRLVNWDPKLGTAISDLEVESREVKGSLWHLRYPVEGEEGRFVVVATTRPETFFGDTAVAVHPDDERFRDLVGRHVVLPILGRRIPIVADEYSDPEKGSGAVKITPAHDFNDFEVGRRHGLEMPVVLDPEARMAADLPAPWAGLDRFDARKRLVAWFEEHGLLEKVEPHVHQVPHGDRSGVPIEPYLTLQWYVNAKVLAEPAIKAVEEGRTRFVPANWANTYFQWLKDIEPWCVSRQLWWGHQIPAWYGPDGRVFVERTEAEARAAAAAHYGRETDLTRDPDVLDTWFSSGLWPFSTLGWPEKTPELARYYPGEALVTGFDIIFFWVARMMMLGIHLMGEVPFRTVYIHALVRDEKGQKMSKSKGNVIDPLDLIEKYGADALRFTLLSQAAQGRDVKLSPARVEGYRNFGTKLWNAARFAEMNGAFAAPNAVWDPHAARLPLNRWLLGRLRAAVAEADAALAAHRFNDFANGLYGFVWNTLCDWFLELSKPVLYDGTEEDKAETRATLAFVLDRTLHLLHPAIPFETEALWQAMQGREGSANDGEAASWLGRQDWPDAASLPADPEAEAELDWVVRAISAVRSLRADMNVPAGAEIPLLLQHASAATLARLERWKPAILRLGRLASAAGLEGPLPKGVAQAVLDEAVLLLPLGDVIDFAAETARLRKEIAKAEAEIARIDAKLGNEQFRSKAPPEVIEEQQERRAGYAEARAKLEAALRRIAA